MLKEKEDTLYNSIYTKIQNLIKLNYTVKRLPGLGEKKKGSTRGHRRC